MSNGEIDSFQELQSEKQILELLTVLETDFPHSLHYCNFIKNVQDWKTKNPTIVFDIFVPDPNDLTDGTSLAIFAMSPKCSKVYMTYSLESSGIVLKQALKNTKRIDWTSTHCEWEAIHERHIGIVKEVLEDKMLYGEYLHNYHYYMPIEKALNVQVRELSESQIVELQEGHARFVDHFWEYKTKETINYIKTCITRNFGLGVQLKDTIISWVVQTHYGGMGMLYTLEQYRKKGYADTLVRKFTKHLAIQGEVPSVVVEANNKASMRLNEKIGYERVCSIFWILFEQNS